MTQKNLLALFFTTKYLIMLINQVVPGYGNYFDKKVRQY